ncbi:MAG: RCC1 domain-containing protein, partial [Candidatus Saccharimonadales bacterium]
MIVVIMERAFSKQQAIRPASGFALPSILIASTVMLIVLTTAASAVASIRTALDTQYYNQLASEASESGLTYAKSCIKQVTNLDAWASSGVTLRPNTDCYGITVSGASANVMAKGQLRTTFTTTISQSSNGVVTASIDATTSLLRKAGGAASQSFQRAEKVRINPGLLVATKSASGYYLVCGIIDAKTWCWGQNDYGQLGDGTTTNSTVPVRVARQPGALKGRIDTDIAAGRGFTCTVSSGEVYCWGQNDKGQLGIGSTAN